MYKVPSTCPKRAKYLSHPSGPPSGGSSSPEITPILLESQSNSDLSIPLQCGYRIPPDPDVHLPPDIPETLEGSEDRPPTDIKYISGMSERILQCLQQQGPDEDSQRLQKALELFMDGQIALAKDRTALAHAQAELKREKEALSLVALKAQNIVRSQAALLHFQENLAVDLAEGQAATLYDQEDIAEDPEVSITSIEERATALEVDEAALEAYEAALQEHEATLKADEAALEAYEAALEEHEATIKADETALQEREVTLKADQAALEERDATLQKNQAALQLSEAALQRSEATFRESEAALQAQEAALREHEAGLREREAVLQEREKALIRSRRDLEECKEEHRKHLEVCREEINQRQSNLSDISRDLTLRDEYSSRAFALRESEVRRKEQKCGNLRSRMLRELAAEQDSYHKMFETRVGLFLTGTSDISPGFH